MAGRSDRFDSALSHREDVELVEWTDSTRCWPETLATSPKPITMALDWHRGETGGEGWAARRSLDDSRERGAACEELEWSLREGSVERLAVPGHSKVRPNGLTLGLDTTYAADLCAWYLTVRLSEKASRAASIEED